MHRSILNFFRASPVTRPLFFLLGDVFLLALSCQLAFLLRYDWDFTNPWSEEYLLYTPIFIAIKIPVFLFFRFYSMSWRYVGAFELVDVAKGIILSSAIVAIVVYIVNPGGIFTGFPRSAVLLDCVLSLLLVGCFRLARRLQRHIHERPLEEGRRTLIVGAGNAGEMIVRDVRRHQESKYRVVAFVDDDETKRGSFLQGIKVMGTTEMIPRLASELNIETILIAVPSATTKEMKRIMSHIRKSLVNDVRVLPGIGKILEGSIALSDIKDVSIEDIVGREQATINHKEIFSLIRGKVVLITGAGGSIGSEIVRQVLKNEPKAVYALDSDETELFNLDNEIKSLFQGVLLTPVVADVCDANKISHVFAHCAPDIVLHAAAYKHVPLMEEYPEEAVRVNVLGTMNLLEESCKRGVEKFVMISTDKAVTPTSVMGTTKRVAEELVKWYNTKNSTKFISVRFGNVVGSRGSVIPIFKNQISRGGPVTVTHRDMTRYFMSIPEAVALVLQAGAMGDGGEVFILNMGEPVKILEVAEEMIRLSGFEPDKDIPIIFCGMRKGEKLYEELLTPAETTNSTSHPKIYVVKNEVVMNDLMERLEPLKHALKNPDGNNIRISLSKIVPAYKPDCTLQAVHADPEEEEPVAPDRIERIIHE